MNTEPEVIEARRRWDEKRNPIGMTVAEYEKLMETSIKNPWLVQRAKFRKSEGKTEKGIDRLLDFDYMGSAEFEFGALPASLKRIRENFSNYVYISTSIDGKELRVLCKKTQKDDINDYLTLLAAGKFQLKEISAFNWLIKDNVEHRYYSADFWWDIDNDIMFWKSEKSFDQKFLIVIKPA